MGKGWVGGFGAGVRGVGGEGGGLHGAVAGTRGAVQCAPQPLVGCAQLRAERPLGRLPPQALYEASKKAKAGQGAKGGALGPPDKLDKRTLMQEAFTERMREQQVRPRGGCCWCRRCWCRCACSPCRPCTLLRATPRTALDPMRPALNPAARPHAPQELERKLAKLAKAMDHLERAKREEEAPLVAQAAQQRIVSGARPPALPCLAPPSLGAAAGCAGRAHTSSPARALRPPFPPRPPPPDPRVRAPH